MGLTGFGAHIRSVGPGQGHRVRFNDEEAPVLVDGQVALLIAVEVSRAISSAVGACEVIEVKPEGSERFVFYPPCSPAVHLLENPTVFPEDVVHRPDVAVLLGT